MAKKKFLKFNVSVDELNEYTVTEEQIAQINKSSGTNFDIDNLTLEDVENIYSFMDNEDITDNTVYSTDVFSDFEVEEIEYLENDSINNESKFEVGTDNLEEVFRAISTFIQTSEEEKTLQFNKELWDLYYKIKESDLCFSIY